MAGTEQKGKEIKEIFINVIKKPENQQVAELSLNLIKLNLICLVFFNSRFSLSNLSQIFEEGINLILSKWDESKRILRDEIYKNLTVNKKKQLLSYIAAINFKQGDYFVEKNKLIKNISDYLVNTLDDKTESEMLYMNSEAILKAIECQHGLLVERYRGIYSFYHLVFQEYLTAKYIVKNNINIREFQNGVNLNNKDRWINIESLIKEIKSDISS